MRNLINISIVFTNKNGMDRFNPPNKDKGKKHPIKTKVNNIFYKSYILES